MADDLERLSCATYTHARRHPIVIGKIGGWTPPFQLTIAQIAVLLVTVLIEVQTWPLWGAHLPRILAVMVGAGVPTLITWSVRRARIEGRSLPRAAVGWVVLATRPRHGQVGGRPYRAGRRLHLGGAKVLVVPAEAYP